MVEKNNLGGSGIVLPASTVLHETSELLSYYRISRTCEIHLHWGCEGEQEAKVKKDETMKGKAQKDKA